MSTYFDWTHFNVKDLERVNREWRDVEDDIYGHIIVQRYGDSYIIDIHYENYGWDQRGFDLEVYESDESLRHNKWLGSIKDIKTAKNYWRFCHRAEKLLIKFISEQEEQLSSELHLYHATSIENFSSIIASGLLIDPPAHNWEGLNDDRNLIFLALDANAASSYVEAQENPPEGIVVFKIKLEDLDCDSIECDVNNRVNFEDVNSVVYSKDIPPEYLNFCCTESEPIQDIDSFKRTYLYDKLSNVLVAV